MIVFVFSLCLCVFIMTYMMTKLTTRQKYRRELWDAVASMRADSLSTIEFRQEVLDTIILSDLKD